MALAELITVSLGARVLRHALGRWIGDKTLPGITGDTLIQIVAEQLTDYQSRRRLLRQFEDIADQIAARLEPLIRSEFRRLPDHEREAAILAVGTTLDKAYGRDEVVKADATPQRLNKAFRNADPGRPSLDLLSEDGRELYDLILRECCEYIVEVTITLPNFGSRAALELLRRQTALQDLVQTVLERIPPQSPNAPARDASEVFSLEYRRLIAREYDTVELFGAQLAPVHGRYSLSVAYVSLGLNYAEPRSNSSQSRRLEDVLPFNRRLLIRGDAGSGKTTLLNWLAVNTARRELRDKLAVFAKMVPFPIKLRQFARAEFPRPDEFVLAAAPAVAGEMPPAWINRVMRNGEGLILIDGLDELPQNRRTAAAAWIKTLIDTYPACTYVVTSRPVAPLDLERFGFTTANLLPMSIPDIRLFVCYWHRAVNSDEPSYDRLESDSFADVVMRELAGSTSLRRLATSPLLCALLCALRRERKTSLPEDRIELYRIALDMLLERRDSLRGVSLDSPIPPSDLALLMQDLAYWLVINGESEASKSVTLRRFRSRLAGMPHARGIKAASILDYLVERSGVLRVPEHGQIDFLHRSFQEYFAAKELVDQDNMGVASSFASRDDWQEVPVLAAGLANARQRRLLIQRMLQFAQTDREGSERAVLLAANCLSVVRELPKRLTKDVLARLAEILPPRDQETANALGRAGELCVPLLARLDATSFSEPETLFSVVALGQIGGTSALDAFAQLGVDGTSAEVASVLVRYWPNFDAATYLERVLRPARLGPEVEVPWEYAELVSQLETVNRVRCRVASLTTLSEIDDLPKLVSLTVDDAKSLKTLDHCRAAGKLRELALFNCARLV